MAKKEGAVYIENRKGYPMTLTATTEEAVKGTDRTLRSVLLTKFFPVKKIDTVTGATLETGFTILTKDEYKTLTEKCKFFGNEIKEGSFVVYDEPPVGALLSGQLVENYQQENAELKEKVAKLEESLVNAAPELSALREKFKAMEDENKALKEQNKTLSEKLEGNEL